MSLRSGGSCNATESLDDFRYRKARFALSKMRNSVAFHGSFFIVPRDRGASSGEPHDYEVSLPSRLRDKAIATYKEMDRSKSETGSKAVGFS